MSSDVQELAQLKASAEDLKSQVDFLMEAQKKRRQQEEFLALRELRRTVGALKAEDEALEHQKRAVSLLVPLSCMHSLLETHTHKGRTRAAHLGEALAPKHPFIPRHAAHCERELP